MDAFVSRKKRRLEEVAEVQRDASTPPPQPQDEEESTDFKLALLASLHPTIDETTLLEALLASEGSVEQASTSLVNFNPVSPRKRPSTIGHQSSLNSYRLSSPSNGPTKKKVVRKGQTLHLYSPEDIEAHTPCSIVHNFLPSEQADALLLELLEESKTYKCLEFKLFDRVVESPHTISFYVNSLAEVEKQKTEYTYDGRTIEVRFQLKYSFI